MLHVSFLPLTRTAECKALGARVDLSSLECESAVSLPPSVAAPLSVSVKRGLACVSGERGFLIDVEAEVE